MARRTQIADEQEAPQSDMAPGCPHPRDVYSLIGHQSAEARLASSLTSGRMHHAWLLTGPKGVGKATLAYRLIRTILSGAPMDNGRLNVPEGDPTASRIASLGHGDFTLLRRPYDFKTKKIRTEIPVAETRKLSEFFTRKASEGGWRVCLIDTADEMTVSAANGVLKTLEEPPEKALLILLSSEPGRLLPTIRSRCMHLPLREVPKPEIEQWLIDQGYPKPLAQSAAHLSRGAPGKAHALAENEGTVLRPLQSLISSFPLGNAGLEHRISDSLAMPTQQAARELFWDGLCDTVQAQSRYAATGEITAGFSPLQITQPVSFWLALSDKLRAMRGAESGLNMDKKTVMLSAFAAIRAA